MPMDEGNLNLQQHECIPHRSFCNLSLMIKKALIASDHCRIGSSLTYGSNAKELALELYDAGRGSRFALFCCYERRAALFSISMADA